jgi:hypothetical protein
MQEVRSHLEEAGQHQAGSGPGGLRENDGRDRQTAHAGRICRLDPGRRVLEHHAAFRVGTQPVSCEQEEVRRGLAPGDQVAPDPDREAALQALLLDPVVWSYEAAVKILDELLAVHAPYLPQFRC